MSRITITLIASLGLAAAAVPQEDVVTIPAGTIIRVRTSEPIDASNAAVGRTFKGVVAQDATNNSGHVVVPKGAIAELSVRSASKHKLTLDLASITAGQKRYAVVSSQQTIEGTKKPGIGKNKRTAKFLGGGAAGGSVIGAIAGGGAGALVGGLVGAGAGAGAQTLTQSKSVHVPAESLLAFRLEHPLTK
jgi:hypothetical protein